MTGPARAFFFFGTTFDLVSARQATAHAHKGSRFIFMNALLAGKTIVSL